MSDDGYSVLRSFSTKEEADVAAAALNASGVPAIVGNAHSAAMDWTVVQAMGGIQVMVPSSMLAESRVLLDEPANDEPSEPLRRNDQWKARILLLWVFGPVALAIGYAVVMFALDLMASH